MDNTPLGRAYLETLSMTDLVRLADDYGIDIPEGLNRRFIIGELLEASLDESADRVDTGALVETEFVAAPDALPETYNENQVTVLLRDPGWIFVCWDFQTNLVAALAGNTHFDSLFLRVNFLSGTKPAQTTDFFDVDVGLADRKWYIHLSGHAPSCRVDLYCRYQQEREELIARSSELPLPVPVLGETALPGKRRLPPLVELSGIAELRKYHFKNHRQSFD